MFGGGLRIITKRNEYAKTAPLKFIAYVYIHVYVLFIVAVTARQAARHSLAPRQCQCPRRTGSNALDPYRKQQGNKKKGAE
jgi:hypothetical protein